MMQIMDLFPQMITRLDSAMSSYKASGTKKDKSGTQFSDVLSAVSDATRTRRGGETGRVRKGVDSDDSTVGNFKEIGEDGEMIEDDTETEDDVLALSALAQGNVVLILEGNKEIDTATEINPDSQNGGDVTLETNVTLTGQSVPSAVAYAASQGETAPNNAAQNEDGQEEGLEGRMARMPEDTEKPREVKSTSKPESDGELCPLENENESGEVKEKKDKGPAHEQFMTEKKTGDTEKTTERVIPTNQTVDVRPEKLSSAESLKSAAGGQPVTQDNLFDAMVDKIETMQSDGMNKMSIQLKPEFLGKVSLQLSLTTAGLQLRINADDLNVRNAIGGQIQSLIETLSSKGIAVADVEVVHTGVGSGDFMSQQGGGAQPEQSAPSRSHAQSGTADTAGFDAPVIDEPGLAPDDGNSSVEYRA